MKEFKGTKGEWYRDPESQVIFHPTEIGSRLAIACQTYSTNEYGSTYSTDEWLANAKLITAAPELLQALMQIYVVLENGVMPSSSLKIHALKAIEKALD